MKIKFWQFEYDFDKDDARIVIPLALLLVSLSTLDANKGLLIALAVAYYVAYFFIADIANAARKVFNKLMFRCPKCRSRKLLLQGYQPYKSDEHHAFYYCTSCKTTSILTESGLTHK